MRRRRLILVLCCSAVIAAGLTIVAMASHLPAWVRANFCDTLVCIAIYLAAAFIRPGARALNLALFTFIYSVIVEFTQLYHAPWIDGFRATLLGKLTIGAAFDWTDMIHYAMGTFIAFLFDICFILRFHRLERGSRV